MSRQEWEAAAEVIEAWRPGVAVAGDAVAVATEVDGVLVVEVDTVNEPA